MLTESNTVEQMDRYVAAASGGYEPLPLGGYRLGNCHFLASNIICCEKGRTYA